MSEADKKADQEQKKINEKATQAAAEKVAREKADKVEADKAEAEKEKEKEKAIAVKELQAAQEKKTALFKKPLFKVMKGNVKHNGIYYAKGIVCPDTKLEEFEAKGFIVEV